MLRYKSSFKTKSLYHAGEFHGHDFIISYSFWSFTERPTIISSTNLGLLLLLNQFAELVPYTTDDKLGRFHINSGLYNRELRDPGINVILLSITEFWEAMDGDKPTLTVLQSEGKTRQGSF